MHKRPVRLALNLMPLSLSFVYALSFAVDAGEIFRDLIPLPNPTTQLVAGYGTEQQSLLTNCDTPGEGLVNYASCRNSSPSFFHTGTLVKITDLLRKDAATDKKTGEEVAGFIQKSLRAQQQGINRYGVCVPGDDLQPTNGQNSDGSMITTPKRTQILAKFCSGSSIFNIFDFSSNTNNAVQGAYDKFYKNNSAFNSETLLGANQYTADQLYVDGNGTIMNPAAIDYISYLSGNALPLNAPPYINTTQELNEEQMTNLSESIAEFMIPYRTYHAELSAGLNVLMSLYAERLPLIQITSDQATAMHISTFHNSHDNKDYVSRLNLDEHMATWRMRDTQSEGDASVYRPANSWKRGIEVAMPVTVQRELAYVAADQLYELHRLREAVEKLSLSLASLQLTMLKQTREKLNMAQHKTPLPGEDQSNLDTSTIEGE